MRKKLRNKSHNVEKNEGEGPLGVFNIHFVAKLKTKLKGGPFGESLFPKKVSQCRKKLKAGDPLFSPGIVCYAEKKGKSFWLSSLGQQVQFCVFLKFVELWVELFSSLRVYRQK